MKRRPEIQDADTETLVQDIKYKNKIYHDDTIYQYLVTNI